MANFLPGTFRICIQFAETLSVGSRPGRDVAKEIGSKYPLAILRESHAERKLIVEFQLSRLAAIRIPQSDVIVAPTGYEPPIAAVANPKAAFVMGCPILCLFAFLHFPKFCAAVLAA